MTSILWILYVASGVAAAVLTNNAADYQTVEALARLAAAALVYGLAVRLGLGSSVGLFRPGRWQSWAIVVPVVSYLVAIHLYAFFGDLEVPLPLSPLATAVALDGSAAGVLEEIAFRGLVLFALLRAFRGERRGLARAVFWSSVLFGVAHLVRLAAGLPLPQVSLLILDASLAGIYYSAFVLHSRSIWPAVLAHAAVNAVIGARAVGVEGFEETVPAWILILVLKLPVVLLGLLLLARTGHRETDRVSTADEHRRSSSTP